MKNLGGNEMEEALDDVDEGQMGRDALDEDECWRSMDGWILRTRT